MAEAEQDPKKIRVFVKTPKSKDKKSFDVTLNIPILEFKQLIAAEFQVSPGDVSLIFAGKILKDSDTLDSHNVQNGYTIHMVLRTRSTDTGGSNGASTSTAPESAAATTPVTENPFESALPNLRSLRDLRTLQMPPIPGFNVAAGQRVGTESEIFQNPDVIRRFLSNPFIQDLMNQPENIRLFMTSNPQMRELIDRNPEISHILNNPELLRQTMDLALHPHMLQELMRTHDRAISNLESIPGGYNALQRMYRDIQEPMLNAATEQNNPFSGLLADDSPNARASNPQQGTENRDPLPNPWRPAERAADTRAPIISSVTEDEGQSYINQLVQQITATPGFVDNFLGNPGMQSMIEQIALSPTFMNLMQSSRNSESMNSLTSQIMGGSALNTLMDHPEALRDILQITAGIGNLQTSSSTSGNRTGNNQTPNQTAGSTTTPTTAPAPAPVESQGDSNTIGTAPQGNGSNFPHSTLNPDEPPEQLYSQQLQQLQAMGFNNQEDNLRALMAAFGDVNGAVDRLLNQPRWPTS